MRSIYLRFMIVIVVAVMSGKMAVGQEPSPALVEPWGLALRVGGEFSDNRDGTATNKQNNFDGIIEPQAVLRYQDADRTSAQLTLMPSVKWHSNPRTAAEGGTQKDTDLFGAVGLALMHRLTPTVTLNAGDQLAYNDDPGKIESGITARRSESYVQNDANAGIDTALTPDAGFGLKGQIVTTRYQESSVAQELDSDRYIGSANPYYMVGSGWTLLGLVSASEYQADTLDRKRGSAVETYNAGFEKKITQDLTGKLMGGAQIVQYDDPALKAGHLFNSNAELVYQAAAPTRFRLNAEYGYTPPSVSAYSAQKSMTFSGEVDHSLLADRVMLRILAQYLDSQYTNEGPDAPGGSETTARLSAHGTYNLTPKLSLTGGYSFEKWDSKLRESFSRNIVDLSIRAEW